MPVMIGAQLLSTVKSAGNAAPGTNPFLIAQYVAPREKNGISVTFATPITIAPRGPAAATASNAAVDRVWKLATDVILVVSPPLVALVAAPSTSLLPIQMETNVGWARAIICACVRPPRMNVVRTFAFDAVSSR